MKKENLNPNYEKRVEELLSKMTLDEKIGQLNQIFPHHAEIPGAEYEIDLREDMIRQGLIGSILAYTGKDEINKVQKIAVEESRLGIPILFAHDVIHGYRTMFPTPLAEACAWDAELAEELARVAAKEAAQDGIAWTFAPMVDVARDARWGRVVEGAGEDAFLGKELAAAKVKGFQGESLDDEYSVIACAKHYLGYGAAEAGLDYNRAIISDQLVEELFLPPFKAAVDAGVGTVMTSFNDVNGMPMSMNKKWVKNKLKEDIGFEGFVVSDAIAIKECINHGTAEVESEAAQKSILAGLDMDMGSLAFVNSLKKLVEEGKVSVDTIDEAARRVLRLKFYKGLFERPYTENDVDIQKDEIPAEYRELAKKAAIKSMVLLKNDNQILPLKQDVKIGLFGSLAADIYSPLGCWHCQGNYRDVVSIEAAMKEKNMNYEYFEACSFKYDEINLPEIKALASKSEINILVLGENNEINGEAKSRTDIGLPGRQKEVFDAVVEAGKPVVVILMNGRPLAIPYIHEKADAVLEAWHLGIEHGHAVLDVLLGLANPSGKLTISFPKAVGQCPIFYNHYPSGRPEGKMMGGLCTTYIDCDRKPLYPFGYGLSYTSFEYSDLEYPKQIEQDEDLKVSVKVKNTGDIEGEEIVQLYINDIAAKLARPVKELKAYKKINLLPGEEKVVELVVKGQDLGYFDDEVNYIVEKGAFNLYVGTSSEQTIDGQFRII